ncbi:uncharacterized protein YukE [Amycolatopsis bartoniae]|uniref:WXG100 family type VII secretion target n=1 Tax=Amycolatopsis bartoniae TaxID=941986 RepID=A0A8H9IXX0_9PSEU|nr:hypothetical protein [Amycolatopsis bartoniae]MBB2934770.1 uncharacterized protein YukE [Amycolatopsis bartoniae]TVT02440.1 hypothetical protein FNH07_27405 [Amycolatopsis bartoniae]GHF44857.1 hypothetical protein GCM10017566_17360 [Amycolatopsis bartoniae]
MAENFRLDPAALEEATRRLGSLGDRITTAYHELAGVLDEHDGCWGEDDIGKAFAQNYVPNAKQVREGAEQAGPGVIELRNDIDDASKTFQSVDEDEARRIDASTGQNS